MNMQESDFRRALEIITRNNRITVSFNTPIADNYSPFIYAYQCTNVAVTGKGTIDGNGSVTFNGWHAIQGPAVDRLRQKGHYHSGTYKSC